MATPDSLDSRRAPLTAERLKAFADAVVAIAMTLLILPLMESVSESAGKDELAGAWVVGHLDQLVSFLLSFGIIAVFWLNHHRLFAQVERVSAMLLWITIAWMLMIVWMPVATAIVGLMTGDPVQKLLYIGTMLVASLLMLVARLYLRRHPELHEIGAPALRNGMLAETMTAVMFAIALLVSFSPLGYWALALMVLVSPLHSLVSRALLRRDRAAGADG